MKSISLTGSNMKNVSIERTNAGDVITVVGVGSDGTGEYASPNMVLMFDDLPANVRNTGDNFLKHLSREFNKFVANEDVDTW